MIKVVAKSIVKTEKIEEYKALAFELVEETRKEEGVISYGLYQDVHDPCIFTFIEEWESQESLDVHSKTPHFTQIVPKLGLLRDHKPEINIYHIIK